MANSISDSMKIRKRAYEEFDKYLDEIYPEKLAELCVRLVSETRGKKDRNMALIEALIKYFDTKTYDRDYYNKITSFYHGHYLDGLKMYKRYSYTKEGRNVVGFHTPNDKKVILISDTMICDGCAALVDDIIDYCNKNYGFNIGHRPGGWKAETDYETGNNIVGHAKNILTIDGVDYEADMSKCFRGPYCIKTSRMKLSSIPPSNSTLSKKTMEGVPKKPKLHIGPREDSSGFKK